MTNIIELEISKTIDGQQSKVSHVIYTTEEDYNKDGLSELIRIAECDMHGDNDNEILEKINDIKKGYNKYSYDNYTFFFEKDLY
jgi:hypothetical protein